jgi:hypothetical protein
MIGGNQSMAIAAIYIAANQDAPVRNHDGLTTIPVDVRPGLTDPQTHIKDFAISFVVDDEFTGFVNSAGTILTNGAVFPHIGATVQIRKSIQGDLNGDGTVSAADIPGFLGAIDDAALVQNQAPWLRVNYIADFNSDRLIDARDIPGFQQACGCAIPEPATLGLAALTLLIFIARARRIRQSPAT